MSNEELYYRRLADWWRAARGRHPPFTLLAMVAQYEASRHDLCESQHRFMRRARPGMELAKQNLREYVQLLYQTRARQRGLSDYDIRALDLAEGLLATPFPAAVPLSRMIRYLRKLCYDYTT